MVRITDARHVQDYVVWLRFSDGTEGEIDLGGELDGEVFEPLRNKRLFRAVKLNREWHTITWPNGADFAPEFLHAAVRRRRTGRSTRPRPRNPSAKRMAAGSSGGG